MATWITPIDNRQQSDIDNKTDKGFLNDTDLNRIEGNVEYLIGILDSLGYGSKLLNLTTKSNWKVYDFIKLSNMQRIVDNIIKLYVVIYPTEYPPVIYITDTNFYLINFLERLENNINQMAIATKQGYRYSGTFTSGQGGGAL